MSAIIPFYKPQDILISGTSGFTLTDDTDSNTLILKPGCGVPILVTDVRKY